jgi:DNA-binding GntR family transcriptional regulator
MAPTRLADDVYEQLREEIIRGELAAGDRLAVPALAVKFSISRSPVREAIQRLVAEGLLTEHVHRGAVVARITASDLAQLYEIREVLEGLAARLAAQRILPRELEELAEILHQHELVIEEGSLSAHMEADVRFHRRVHEIAGNEELLRQMGRQQAMIRMAMHTTVVSAGPGRALSDHRDLLQALQAHDPDLAERVARDHIVRLRVALLTQSESVQS